MACGVKGMDAFRSDASVKFDSLAAFNSTARLDQVTRIGKFSCPQWSDHEAGEGLGDINLKSQFPCIELPYHFSNPLAAEFRRNIICTFKLFRHSGEHIILN